LPPIRVQDQLMELIIRHIDFSFFSSMFSDCEE
jgi:hypothetical protein